jgi:hypothetical protein
MNLLARHSRPLSFFRMTGSYDGVGRFDFLGGPPWRLLGTGRGSWPIAWMTASLVGGVDALC